MSTREILLSTRDAGLLDGLVRRYDRLDLRDDAVEDLADTLGTARIVDAGQLPTNVVALGSTVDYCELPEGAVRTVTLVHPAKSDARHGRISVLSPVGRALLGRRIGNLVTIDLPTGERRRIKVERVRRGGEDE